MKVEEKLNIGKIDAVIADECQKLKTSSSNTYKNFKRSILLTKHLLMVYQVKYFYPGTPA